MINFENLDKRLLPGVGKYGIPEIRPETRYPSETFIPVSAAIREKQPEDKIVHHFVDDYRFARLWNTPDRYTPILQRFKAVCSPDFSTYTDMPMAMQIYNHYRKHWLAAYWQERGMTVYPTISWSTPDSFEWCFDGEPAGSIVAVSSVGCNYDREARRLFLRGYEEMMKRLSPPWVIFYGHVFEECDFNVIRIRPFSNEFLERGKEHARRQEVNR